MTINIKKSQVVLFRTAYKKKWSSATTWPKIFYQSPPKGQVDKFLGVHVDSSQSFAAHVSYIRAIILRQVSIINRANYFLPPDILVTLYYSFIYPYISYCGSVRGITFPSVTNKLKFAQNPAIKAVFQLPRLYPIQDLYSNFAIIPLEQIVKKLNLYLSYSAYHKNLPPQLLSYFNINNSEGLCLRSSNRSFIVHKCVSSSAQRSPIHKSILQWNVLPFSVELSTSFRTLYNNVIKFWYYNSLNSYSICFNYPCFLFCFFSLFFIFQFFVVMVLNKFASRILIINSVIYIFLHLSKIELN